MSNPRVFWDISIDNGPAERMVFELFADVVPKTAENFRALCTGEKGIGSTTRKPLHYKGCVFHRIIKDVYAQGGVLPEQNGTGGESIYGGTFLEDNFQLDHTGPGILSMSSDHPNANGSRFILTFRRLRFLDGCHVVFGKLIKGLDTLLNISQAGTSSGKTSRLVEITDCGEIPKDIKSNVESDKPQTSSVNKEESGAKLQLQRDTDSMMYELYLENLVATLKKNMLVTSGTRHIREQMSNPHVFWDISIDNGPTERMVFELFADVVPKTAENFRALCTGEKGTGSTTKKPLHYKGCVFHRIIKGFFAQGGALPEQNGTGGESIYGGTFPDENFELDHTGPGILSMSSDHPNENGSRFILSFCRQPSLDGCHVVFGKLIKGLDTLLNISQAGTSSGKPCRLVEITDCGEISKDKPQSYSPSALLAKSLKRKSECISSSSDDGKAKHQRVVKPKHGPSIIPDVVLTLLRESKLRTPYDSKSYGSSDDQCFHLAEVIERQHSDDSNKSSGEQRPVRNQSKTSASPISNRVTRSQSFPQDAKSSPNKTDQVKTRSLSRSPSPYGPRMASPRRSLSPSNYTESSPNKTHQVETRSLSRSPSPNGPTTASPRRSLSPSN